MPGEDRDEQPDPLDEERDREPRRRGQRRASRRTPPTSTATWRTSAAPTSSPNSVTSFDPRVEALEQPGRVRRRRRENSAWRSSAGARRRSSCRRSSPCGACRCTRTGTGRLRGCEQPVRRRRAVVPRHVGRRVRRRRPCADGARGVEPRCAPASDGSRPAITSDADEGRHDVAERRVRVVLEVVAVEQRVVPEAGVALADPCGTASRWYFCRSRSAGASSPNAPPGASRPSGVSATITPSPTNAQRQPDRGAATPARPPGPRRAAVPRLMRSSGRLARWR